MRSSIIIATLCAFGFVGAQQTDTIFQILNNTNGSSPAPQFAQFLQSSPDYQPIVDLLNDPTSNLTVFVPSDGLFYNITGQIAPVLNQTNSTTSAGTASSSTASAAATSFPSSFGLSDFLSILKTSPASAKPTNQAKYVRLDNFNSESPNNYFVSEHQDRVIQALSGIKLTNYITLDSQNSSNFTNVTTSPFVNEFSVLDLLYYHVLNGSITLNNNQTAVFDSLLTNNTVNRFGSGSPLLVQPGNSTGNLTVGDGLGYDANINNTYKASNGAIYLIDKVLIPPVNISSTLSVLQNASLFESLLERSNNSLDALNNSSNFTVFVPDNNALQNVDISTLDNDTIDNLIQAHIFQGVYYSTNLTDDSSITTESISGANVTLQKTGNSSDFTVNGTNVIQPNILLNNGVMHLIDGVLNFQTTETNTTGSPTSSETASNMIPSETAPSETAPSETAPSETAPSETSSSFPTATQLSSANVPTLASMLVILSSTFVFYFLYA